MAIVRWTGHPFVDAGLYAIAAVTGVSDLEELTSEHLQRAARELERVLLSDQALGLGVERAFAGPLSQLFPNSELVNPQNWKKGETLQDKAENVRRKFRESLQKDLERAIASLEQSGIATSGDATCDLCGRRASDDAATFVRKDKMPLLAGIVNFYPAFAYGVRVCGLCAFASRFLPMAVMRTGVSKRLWFLHTQALQVATNIAKRYGWQHFNKAIASNEPLDFYGEWQTAGEAGTVLYLLFELLEQFGDQLREIFQSPLPTTAYVFSNDNKNPYVRALPVPHSLMVFLANLQLKSQVALGRFREDLLDLKPGLRGKERDARIRFVENVANRILRGEGLIGLCLLHGENPDRLSRLAGGWVGHRLYLQEVRGVPLNKLAILERLGLAIAQSEDAKRRIMELRQSQSSDLYGIFLHYVREGWLDHDEFYALLPPNEYASAGELRDILLAVIYEWQHSQERGEEFPTLAVEAEPPTPDEVLQRIQQIGERLLKKLPNPLRWVDELQTARTDDRIRAVYLLAAQRGVIRFADFSFLVPLGDRFRTWLLRDYLLAFLFDRAREQLNEEKAIAGE